MSPVRSRLLASLSTCHRLLFDHPSTLVALAGAFLVLVSAFALNLTFLHDEGVFTFDLAATMRDSFPATLFLLKAKPVLALLYAPFSFLGLDAYLLFHAVLASAAIILVGATARHLGIAHPNVAGWVLATSMGYTVAASNGFANADGAFFLSLFLFLYFSDRRTWAAVVLGMLPLVRNELALVWIAFLAWDLWTRKDRRFVLAALAFPVAYAGLGALYHRDLLWLLATFPGAQGIPASISFPLPSLNELGEYLRRTLLANFGLLGLLALFGWHRGDRRSIFLHGLTWSILAVMTVLQFFGAFGFDISLRYHVALLPLVALVTAYAVSSPARLPWLGAGILAALLLLFPPDGLSPFVAVVLVAAACRLFLGHDAFRKPADLLLLACAAGFALTGLGTTDFGRTQHLETHRTMALLRSSGIYRGQPVFTDIHIARYDTCSGVTDAYFLANEAIVWEASRFLNKANGQYDDIVRALERQRFILESESHAVRRDAIYLLEDGERTRRWRERIEKEGPAWVRMGRYRACYWPDERR
ncbi:MAG: hypothetical protein QME96_11025 [Myxococcota bacterium]|nr:hypothetical protein [Myxococcota bacterium]